MVQDLKVVFAYNHLLGSNVCLFGHRDTEVAGGLGTDDGQESVCGPAVGDGPKVVDVVAVDRGTAVDQLVADGQKPPMELWRW